MTLDDHARHGPAARGARKSTVRPRYKHNLMTLVCVAAACLSPSVLGKPGDVDQGAEIYAERCVLCHGEDGDGLGPAAERLNPPPRDFTLGQYKIKTTGFDDIVPNDEDLFRMVRDGMPATAIRQRSKS